MSAIITQTTTHRVPLEEQLRVVGVARQSRTDDDTMSVEDQIERIRAYCERENYQLVDVYTEESTSGRTPLAKRHGLLRAVEDVEERRADVVLVAYFDRLARSFAVQQEVVDRVEDANGQVAALDQGQLSNKTAASWVTGAMLAIFAEMYARSVGERTRDAKVRAVMRGVPPFPNITPAYVRRDDGTLEQHPVNGPLVREACERRAKGESYKSLARFLNEHGVAITVRGVTVMLNSPLLHGEIRFGTVVNEHAIDDPVIDRVLAQRIKMSKSTRGRKAKSERLLARLGILKCAACDSRLVVGSSKPKGTTYSYYACGDPLCTARASISATQIEDFVTAEAIRLSQLDAKVGHASDAEDAEAARDVLADVSIRLDSAIRTLSGLAGEAATRETLDALVAERDAAATRVAHLDALKSVESVTTEQWSELSLEAKRDVISATIESVVVSPGKRGGGIPLVDRVVVHPRTTRA